ncbi:MAG: peroxiredoxin-like family protein [Elainellaceae cyanobacterium]
MTTSQSLTQQLADTKAASSDRIPPDARAVMNQATEELRQSGLVEQSLKVGDRLPEVELPNATGETIRLYDLLKQGPLVISFYRGQWCPYCNLELKALQAVVAQVEAEGASLVAISPQTPDQSLSTQEKNELEFEVLSDVGNRVARQFGLVFALPDDLRPIYESFGIDLPAHNGDRTFELPVPATYVVATDGSVTYAFADADYTRRADPSEVLNALNTLKASV